MRKFFSIFLITISSHAAFALTPLYWKTTQQIPVVFYQTHATPMASIHVAFRAGSAFDGDKFGLANLTGTMLDQGNENLSATQMADLLAESGAIYSHAINRDMADYSLTTLTEDKAFKQATSQFTRILTHPDFLVESFEQQKALQLASIKNEDESATNVAYASFFNALYPHHPYGHRISGTPTTVNALQLEDLKNFYKRYYISENAVIVIVGALSKAQATEISNQLLAPLPHGEATKPIPAASILTESTQIHVPFPSTQSTLCIGQLGIDHHSPHYFPLIVGNYILGGGSLVSRLAYEVREQKGFTYGINSDFIPMPGKGPFIITLSTKHEQEKKALELTLDVLTNFIKTGPTTKELAAAKHYLSGSFPLSLSSNTEIAKVLLRVAFYNMPPDFLETYVAHIEAVTQAEIKAAFQELLNVNKMVQVSVGP